MQSLLDHLVDITSHRDHTQLDVSVIAAVRRLVGARRARALEIFKVRDRLYLRPRVWLLDGDIVTSEANLEPEPAGDPLDRHPLLLAAIEERRDNVEAMIEDGSTVLWLPLWMSDRISGCLEIGSSEPLAGETRALLFSIVRVYRNFRNLLDYSERDSLTGLLNRKTFDENFSRMVSAATPQNPLPENDPDRRLHIDDKERREQWLAVIDIDHFKRVNDHFGHLYGDEVLILVANLLRNSFRAQDRIFRFGGEEFVVLLRSATLAEARNTFSRFRANVEKYPFPQVGQVTVSIGFVNISQQTPVVILGHADQALYYAKMHGRNLVCHYEELVASGELQSQIANDDVEFF